MSRLPLLLFVPLFALAACGANGEPESTSATLSEKVVQEVREEIRREILDVGGGKDGQPKAQITTEGQLLIGGEPVTMDEGQRALALAYREDIAVVAEAGAAIGMEAAVLAKDSVVAAIEGVFSGEGSGRVEATVKEKAKEIEASAQVLCDHLPQLYASQQALAAAVPEFAPYATMDQSDIDDCHVNVN